MKQFKNTITFTETEDAVKIDINMESLLPCLKSIQQYRPTFKVQDIMKEQKYLESEMYNTITEKFNECLYGAMDELL